MSIPNMDPQLALVDLDRYLAGLILCIGRVRLESGDANFKAIATGAEALSIQFNTHSVPSKSEPGEADWSDPTSRPLTSPLPRIRG